ncbi:GIY-YIG nuclease family protein [candidate division WS5 bacterium]|uniref:GIY-YIG nuclease family protein n=1 Tax=candidate division WS5 bacterium TaxID=2093353 RepID=A0A419DEL8_9BACT|nr:MAG: GIY-YIG nuclease family protein [candidate division WS5 bacterium]
MKKSYVYILANKKNGTLYIGVASDLKKRVFQHKEKLVEGFSKKYGIDRLIYYEESNDITSAIIKEKQLKKWNRAWKIRLIEENNPNWDDLYDKIL